MIWKFLKKKVKKLKNVLYIFSKIGWRLGLQAVTGVVFLTFILGTFYRSASLYHPQRRAILHLKNQKRKIKDKNKTDDGPPFFDFSTLKSKTVRILLVSTGISAFGINTPIFYLVKCSTKQNIYLRKFKYLRLFLKQTLYMYIFSRHDING